MEHSVIDYIYETDDAVYEEVNKNEEYREANERALKIYQKLSEMLTDEQKAEFEKYIENEADKEAIQNRIIFKCGIKYGVRFVAESMFD